MVYSYKQDESGAKQVDSNGNYIVVNSETGEEKTPDLLVLLNDKIPTKNSEAAANRQESARLKATLKEIEDRYKDIGDPEEALKLIQIAKSVSDKDLVDGAKAEQAKLDLLADSKQQIETLKKQYGDQLNDVNTELQSLKEKDFNNFKLSQFSGSDALKGTIYEHHVNGALSEFGDNIQKNENGETIVKDWNGNIIRTTDPENMGNPAGVNEALKKLIETHPNKKNIMFAGSGAGGKQSPGGVGNDGFVTATRAQMKDPRQYQELKKKAGGDINKIRLVD